MKQKLFILLLILFSLISVVNANMVSDINYYFNLDYPNATNLVPNGSVPYGYSGAGLSSGIINDGTQLSKTGGVFGYFRIAKYNMSMPFSLSLWVNVSGTRGSYGISGSKIANMLYRDTTSTQVAFSYGDVLYAYFRRSTAPSWRCHASLLNVSNLGDSKWHHLVLTKNNDNCDNTTFTFYVDNVKRTDYYLNFSNPINSSYLNSVAGDYYLTSTTTTPNVNFSADEYAFWQNYLLTDSDVNLLYNGGLGLQYPFCIADWSCIGYETCVEPMVNASCNSVVDLNSCGQSYTGNYSEFTPQTCSYSPITGYVPYHTATDIPAVVIDFSVEFVLQMIAFVGIIVIIGLGIWLMHVL